MTPDVDIVRRDDEATVHIVIPLTVQEQGAPPWDYWPISDQALLHRAIEALRAEAHELSVAQARARRWSLTCEWCGAPFEAAAQHARFCSGRCRVAAHRAKPPAPPRTGRQGLPASVIAQDKALT